MYSIDFQMDTAGLSELIGKLKVIADKENLSKAIASSLSAEVRDRIHVRGLDKDGQLIGNYSKGYMKVRTGDFKNSTKFSRGKNKGKNKNAGTFTDRTIRLNKQTGVFTGEEKVGTPRPQYNRSTDTKVILSLTRQMENDFGVVYNGLDGYGLGYKNELNFKKSQWAEEKYRKQIFALTGEEENMVMDTVHKYFVDAGIS